MTDNCIRSPPRNCSHEALPFVEAAAKAKLAGSIETQPGHHLAALSAFRIREDIRIARRYAITFLTLAAGAAFRSLFIAFTDAIRVVNTKFPALLVIMLIALAGCDRAKTKQAQTHRTSPLRFETTFSQALHRPLTAAPTRSATPPYGTFAARRRSKGDSPTYR